MPAASEPTGLDLVDRLATLRPPTIDDYCAAAFDRESGVIEPGLPPVGSGLRWNEFIKRMADTYEARFDSH